MQLLDRLLKVHYTLNITFRNELLEPSLKTAFSGFGICLCRSRRGGGNKIKSGELIRVCMSSDFFLEEADEWRAEA